LFWQFNGIDWLLSLSLSQLARRLKLGRPVPLSGFLLRLDLNPIAYHSTAQPIVHYHRPEQLTPHQTKLPEKYRKHV